MSKELSIDEKRKILKDEFERLAADDIYDSELHDILNDPKYQGKDIDDLSDSEIYEIFEKFKKTELKNMSQ